MSTDTISDVYKNIDPANKPSVTKFENVLRGMTEYLEQNPYNYTSGLPLTGPVDAKANTTIDGSTFTINLFTTVEFLSKIPGDGFHDFLTMGRNDTFKNVKSEFIFIYILGNFMKNITCMKSLTNKENLIVNTLYTYAAAMDLLNDKTNKMDLDEEEEVKAPAAASRSSSRAAPPVSYATTDSKDGLGDGNDIAHRIMESRTTLMTGTGTCNKIGQSPLFQSDYEKAINILYYVDNTGGILQMLYDSWVNLCPASKVTLPDSMPASAPADTTTSISTTTTETVRKVDINILFATVATINTPEWYKIQYVKNTLAKYTKDYVSALYQVFATKRINSAFTFDPQALPIITIPFLEILDDNFLDDPDEKLQDMEFDLAKLLFKERLPIYFFADADKGKVGPGILEVLRTQPVLLIESSVIDLDEASEGFSKTTQELNKFYNPTVAKSSEPTDENSNIIGNIKEGKTFTFNFYSDDNCLIEQFVISEFIDPKKQEIKKRINDLDDVDLTTISPEKFIKDVLALFTQIQDKKMIAALNAAIDTTQTGQNRIVNRIRFMITENMNGAKHILTKIKQYLDNDSNLQITNKFVSTPNITEISVNNMTGKAVELLKKYVDILVPPEQPDSKKKSAKNPPTRSVDTLLRILQTSIIETFSTAPAPPPPSSSSNKRKQDSVSPPDIINAIQNFLIPLTAKRTGDLLPLCLWGFLADKPNKFYDTGDLNAFELGLLLLTSEKNFRLFQDLLLACPGTDEVQDYLRLVRCGDNSNLFSTAYTGANQAVPRHLKPLHDCIPPIFNPKFVLDIENQIDPCPISYQAVDALNISNYNGASHSSSSLEPLPSSPPITPPIAPPPIAPPPITSEPLKIISTEGSTTPEGQYTDFLPATNAEAELEEKSDSQPYWNNEEGEAITGPKGGKKRRKIKTIKKRKQKIQKKTIKIKTKFTK